MTPLFAARTIDLVRLLLRAALIFATFPLFGWTEPVERRIAQKSAQLAPPDLRLLIQRFDRDYVDGRLDAASAEPRERNHNYIVQRGSGPLKQQIESEVTRAIATIRSRRSTADFVRSLGRIAHLVSDANHPFHAADSDRRLAAMKPDFDSYLQSRVEVIPTIFYGLSDSFRLSHCLDDSLKRSASYYSFVSSQYFPPNGPERTAADFDDRSTAFAVVSLSYSHAVTDLVNIYYYIWKEAGGDVRTAAAMRKSTVLVNPSAEGALLGGGFGKPAERQ